MSESKSLRLFSCLISDEIRQEGFFKSLCFIHEG